MVTRDLITCLGPGRCGVPARELIERGIMRAARVVAVVIAFTCSMGGTAHAELAPGADPPQLPRAAGTVGLPGGSPSPVLREEAVAAMIRNESITRTAAERRLDLQAKVRGSLTDRLMERGLRGLSQVYMDQSGGFVVTVGPKGNIAKTRAMLASLDLADVEVKRVALDRDDLADDRDRVRALLRSVRPGKATLTLVNGGLEITAAAGLTTSERRVIDQAATLVGVLPVKETTESSLFVTPEACHGAIPPWGRVCNEIAGGAYYQSPNTACSLGYHSAVLDGNLQVVGSRFMTAGHCVTPGGAPVFVPNVPGQLLHEGGEVAQAWGTPGDAGLLLPVTSRPRWSGWVNWTNGVREPITYSIGWWEIDGGAPICHSGITTGYSCGTYGGLIDQPMAGTPGTTNLPPVTLYGMVKVNGMCTAGGDSGGPVFTGDGRGAVGIHSGHSPWACGHPFAYAVEEPIARFWYNWMVLPYGY